MGIFDTHFCLDEERRIRNEYAKMNQLFDVVGAIQSTKAKTLHNFNEEFKKELKTAMKKIHEKDEDKRRLAKLWDEFDNATDLAQAWYDQSLSDFTNYLTTLKIAPIEAALWRKSEPIVNDMLKRMVSECERDANKFSKICSRAKELMVAQNTIYTANERLSPEYCMEEKFRMRDGLEPGDSFGAFYKVHARILTKLLKEFKSELQNMKRKEEYRNSNGTELEKVSCYRKQLAEYRCIEFLTTFDEYVTKKGKKSKKMGQWEVSMGEVLDEMEKRCANEANELWNILCEAKKRMETLRATTKSFGFDWTPETMHFHISRNQKKAAATLTELAQ